MDRQTLWDWVIRYNEAGVEGLLNLPRSGRSPRLNAAHLAELVRLVEEGPDIEVHGRSFFGYKNHVNADARHKLIREYGVTDASGHDSQAFDDLLSKGNTSSDVYDDSAWSAPPERYQSEG